MSTQTARAASGKPSDAGKSAATVRAILARALAPGTVSRTVPFGDAVDALSRAALAARTVRDLVAGDVAGPPSATVTAPAEPCARAGDAPGSLARQPATRCPAWSPSPRAGSRKEPER